MDYRHLDPDESSYSYNQIVDLLNCGNGELVERLVNNYWMKYLITPFSKSPSTSTHWDFKIGSGDTTTEIELRRLGRDKRADMYKLYLGFGNTKKANEIPWFEKAKLLKDGNGGYLTALCEGPLFHLFWFPAHLLLKKRKNTSAYMSEIQMIELFDLNVRDYMQDRRDR
jgi:hypothetical protein